MTEGRYPEGAVYRRPLPEGEAEADPITPNASAPRHPAGPLCVFRKMRKMSPMMAAFTSNSPRWIAVMDSPNTERNSA